MACAEQVNSAFFLRTTQGLALTRCVAAAESSLHALSSAAGAITGIAILDVGRHIADELIQLTAALNDLLARSSLLLL